MFLNAPDTDSNGNAYTYTVTEDPVPGYTTAVYKEAGRSYEIVNTHEREKITITGRKLWLNPDGTPADPDVNSISLTLRRINEQGEVERIPEDYSENGPKVTLPSKDNAWTYTFANYDRYAPGGYEYKHVLVEGNPPAGWFPQTEAAPAGVTVTAEYDPEDITTFRNFKKPDLGYAMIYCYLSDSSKPKNGNTAVPLFTFTVDMERTAQLWAVNTNTSCTTKHRSTRGTAPCRKARHRSAAARSATATHLRCRRNRPW